MSLLFKSWSESDYLSNNTRFYVSRGFLSIRKKLSVHLRHFRLLRKQTSGKLLDGQTICPCLKALLEKSFSVFLVKPISSKMCNKFQISEASDEKASTAKKFIYFVLVYTACFVYIIYSGKNTQILPKAYNIPTCMPACLPIVI